MPKCDLDGNPLIPLGEGAGRIWLSKRQDDALAALTGPARYACLPGGTRSGKTFLAVRTIFVRALKAPESRHAIIRSHQNAARKYIGLDTLPTVNRICFPNVKLTPHRQDGYWELPNKSQIWLGGLADKKEADKILGSEYVSIYLNEASQISYASFLTAETRLAQVCKGLKQRFFVDLNPVGKGHWTNALFGEHRDPVSGQPQKSPADYARAFLNPRDNAHNLSAEYIASLENLPERQRRRFYEGVYVDEVDGALWTYELIESTRCEPEDIPIDKRASVIIVVDPSGAASREDEGHDEIGIVVAARGQNGDAYILEDLSLRDGPAVWGRRAVTAYHNYAADCIVAESNFGGAMVEAVIKACDPNVPVRLITASRGKAVRAEPVSTRYFQKQVHHAGRFAKLEDQLCAFSQSGYTGSDSPDHADAAIWAVTFLLGISDGTGIIEYYRREAESRPKENPHPWSMPSDEAPDEDADGIVELYVPEGTTHVSGMAGTVYRPDADGIIKVSADDAKVLMGAGYVKVIR